MISADDMNKAFDRIARTEDGELLYRYLQKILLGTLSEHAPQESALRTEHGRRRLAAELMAKMAEGIDQSVGPTTASRTERTVVFRSNSEPARRAVARNIREWARDNDPELKPFIVNAAGQT